MPILPGSKEGKGDGGVEREGEQQESQARDIIEMSFQKL